MKYFIIADDVGNAVYYDHPEGRMICMPLATAQAVADENFNDSWRVVKCKKAVIAFHQYSYMSFCAFSDQGESEQYLLCQLQFMQDLIQLKYGPLVYTKKNVNFLRQQGELKKLFDTMKHLCLNKQCFLVQSIERLNISEDMRRLVYRAIKETVRTFENPRSIISRGPVDVNIAEDITHVLLFAGTKLISNWNRNKVVGLGTSDVLLLLTVIRAHFNPTGTLQILFNNKKICNPLLLI
jgi:hypothetical protein